MDLYDDEDDYDYFRDSSRSSSRGRSRTRREQRQRRRPRVIKVSRPKESALAQPVKRRSWFRAIINFPRDVRVFIGSVISLSFRSVVLTSVISIFLVYCAILTAAFYAFLYWYILPEMVAESPLYFDFDPKMDGQPSFFGCEQGVEQYAFERRETMELPTAWVDLIHADNQWELRNTLNFSTKADKPTKMKKRMSEKGGAEKAAKNKTKGSGEGGKGRSKHKADKARAQAVIHEVDDWRLKLPDKDEEVETLPFRFLARREKYDIYIHLVIRDNEHNYALGNIMVGVDLLTYQKETLASSRRPTIMFRKPPRSLFSWFYEHSILQFIPNFWSGSSEESHGVETAVLKIQSFEKFMEQDEDFLSVQSVKVTLSQPALQLSSAKVVFHCQLEGIRYYMYHWRTPTFLLYMTVCFLFEASTTIVTSLLAILVNFTRQETEKLYR